MKIHEYQAKALFAQHGIPVPKGKAVANPAEAYEAYTALGGRVVLKAQVHAGGRGKAGGIRMAASPEEAERVAQDMLGKRLVTHQTGPTGAPVNRLLVEESVPVRRELYVGLLVDAESARTVVLASPSGGMDIEEVAARTPEKIFKEYVDPCVGLRSFQARRLAYALGIGPALIRPATDLLNNLYLLFWSKDASLVEVNPLVETEDGRLLALDAKVNFDDNATFRHKELASLQDPTQDNALERRAADNGIVYIQLDGDVGCIVNGAGLAMATMDIIHNMGAEPANFLDIGGAGSGDDKVAEAFKIIIADPKVKRVFVNVFGGILRCDYVARGVVKAARETGCRLPMVARLQGTNSEEAQRILAESGLPVSFATDIGEAARLAVGKP